MLPNAGLLIRTTRMLGGRQPSQARVRRRSEAAHVWVIRLVMAEAAEIIRRAVRIRQPIANVQSEFRLVVELHARLAHLVGGGGGAPMFQGGVPRLFGRTVPLGHSELDVRQGCLREP